MWYAYINAGITCIHIKMSLKSFFEAGSFYRSLTVLKPGTGHINHPGFKLVILLPLCSSCWDYNHVPPYQLILKIKIKNTVEGEYRFLKEVRKC